MGKLVLDKRGDLRKGVFYRFDVQFDDATDSEEPTPDWIVIPRTPTNDVLRVKNNETWMWIAEGGDLDTEVKIKDCTVDSTHETHRYYTKFIGIPYGGKRISPFIPTKNFCSFALSNDLRKRIESLKIRGARIDPIVMTDEDLKPDEKLKGFWAFQFVGRIVRRMPKPVDVPNRCPHCGKAKIVCETCGDWNGTCKICHKATVVAEDKLDGPEDKRIPVERLRWGQIIEGKTWDGSDLVSSHGINYASKRFIDWLLRIHAAPFYAEPVYFCIDGMNDQQKKWFDDLQRPFEV